MLEDKTLIDAMVEIDANVEALNALFIFLVAMIYKKSPNKASLPATKT